MHDTRITPAAAPVDDERRSVVIYDPATLTTNASGVAYVGDQRGADYVASTYAGHPRYVAEIITGGQAAALARLAELGVI